MKVLVAGASGATGKHAVQQLAHQGHLVKVLARSISTLPEHWKSSDQIEFVQASILEMPDPEMQRLVQGCDAVISCLGHNLNLKGVYGKPRRLVTDAVRKLTDAICANEPISKVKFILMNTTGNRNKNLNERFSWAERLVVGLIRILVPPHPDNEQAAEYLRTQIGPDHPYVEWAVVRPDSLLNEDAVSDYSVHPSPTRSPLFNSGKTSRINVGHFMADLISDSQLWSQWAGQMPVIYNVAK